MQKLRGFVKVRNGNALDAFFGVIEHVWKIMDYHKLSNREFYQVVSYTQLNFRHNSPLPPTRVSNYIYLFLSKPFEIACFVIEFNLSTRF